MYHIKPVIQLERFCIVTQSYAASFSIKTCLHKTNNIFFDSKTEAIYLNLVLVYESKLKIVKIIFLNYAYVSSQLQTKTFAWNEMVQSLHNHKCYGADQSRFKKTLTEFCQELKEQLRYKDPFIFTSRPICN